MFVLFVLFCFWCKKQKVRYFLKKKNCNEGFYFINPFKEVVKKKLKSIERDPKTRFVKNTVLTTLKYKSCGGGGFKKCAIL